MTSPKRPKSARAVLSMASLVSLAVAACGSQGNGPPHPKGATVFTSPPPASLSGGVLLAGGGMGGAGTPAPSGSPAGDAAGASGGGAARTVEEADIYKVMGTALLVLNAYRGLQIIDLADPAAPRLLSRVPVVGTPVDLYLRGTVAYVVVSDWFWYAVAADGTSTHPRRGSRVLAVDVADPAAPAVISDFPVDGQVDQTRVVGNILYVFSRRFWWYDWTGVLPASPTDTVFVQSFDLADPAHPAPVGRLEFPTQGWSTHANVTSDRVTLSFAGWQVGDQGIWGPVTSFQAVDISDPGGALRPGAAFLTSGMVNDRWGMDFDAGSGTFRAALGRGWNGGADLQIWSSPGPGAAAPLSRVKIDVAESLTASRFDGSRAYLVTALRVDPLWAVDLADPASPRLAGQLSMPGQLDYLEPRGGRLVALGHTNEAGLPFQLAVSLLDVADLAHPALLSRAVFGAGWSWLSVSPDDLRKAFLVFDPPPAGIGLVLVPLQGWDPAGYAWVGGTQLVDWSGDAVKARGFLSHPGSVTRAFPLDAGGRRLAALSDQALQTIDAADRGAPRELARLDLARPVVALEVVRGKAVELSGDWTRGSVELAVTEALDPEAATPLARLPVGAPSASMLRDGDVIWLLAHDWGANRAWLQAVDFSDPLHPALRGQLDLEGSMAIDAMPFRFGWGDEVVRVGHALVVHRFGWGLMLPAAGGPAGSPAESLQVYDLGDPDRPALAATVSLPDACWAWGLTAAGSLAYITHYEWSPDRGTGSYQVDRLDVSTPAAPILLPRVNVPGVFFGASDDGGRLYTLEDAGDASNPGTTWLHGLELQGDGKARLYGSALLPGWPAGTALGQRHAWAAAWSWSSATGASAARLLAVDLSDVSVESDQGLDGWAWLRKQVGGKLFLQGSWSGDDGTLVYGLAAPGKPAFEQVVRTSGWVFDIVAGQGHAYLPSGPYGVPMVTLDPPIACGGIAGLGCPAGLACLDDPSDTCSPADGGADCPGICVP